MAPTCTLQIKGQWTISSKTVVFSEISFRPETALQRRETKKRRKNNKFLNDSFYCNAWQNRLPMRVELDRPPKETPNIGFFAAAQKSAKFSIAEIGRVTGKKQKPRASISVEPKALKKTLSRSCTAKPQPLTPGVAGIHVP
ncbi:MAG TPA: hypothetical protein PLY75_04075 [Gammaproteobacteria bacterium]|nr:hypothetical protein [Gammaproteobacteria bacterium]HOP15115.1 hypothetical protein [Gammaproteobacteria bacterium]HPQ24090.1 hypothetical protein [Gammaproteobacteria bacterium]